MPRRERIRVRFSGRRAVDGGVGDDAESEGGGDAGQQLGGEVDGQLLPGDGAARDLLHEHRPDRARRVDRGAGDGRDRDDRGEHDEADREPGPAGGGLAVDHAEDAEHQEERADELGEERLVPRGVSGS